MVKARVPNLSISEFLDWESNADEKHEYHNGEVFAMAGGTVEHGTIASNATTCLSNALRKSGKDCFVMNSDVKIRIEKSNKFVYPDGMMICGKAELYEERKDIVINPKLIIEVLSESSEKYDRGAKFRMYCSLPSFSEYVLIDQYRPIVDVIYRQSRDSWSMMTTLGLDKDIYLHTLDQKIAMSDIYWRLNNLQSPEVSFPES